jgi:hypothetical protein
MKSLGAPWRWSLLVGLLTFLLSADAAAAATATTAIPSPNQTINVGGVSELTCQFVDSRRRRPIRGELVNVLRGGVYVATVRTDGNGFATWLAQAIYGPLRYTFTLRQTSEWQSSKGAVTIVGQLPTVMAVSVRGVGPVRRGMFNAQVVLQYTSAIYGVPGGPLGSQVVSVRLKHTASQKVLAINQRTDAMGRIQFNIDLPEAFRSPGTLTVEGPLPSSSDRFPGWFKDTSPYPAPFVRVVSSIQ